VSHRPILILTEEPSGPEIEPMVSNMDCRGRVVTIDLRILVLTEEEPTTLVKSRVVKPRVVKPRVVKSRVVKFRVVFGTCGY
jgi:hypothetical protein